MNKEKIASYIDHTLLKANATEKEISDLCEQAKKYNFASVCINPCYVSFAKEKIYDSSVKICTVIGFPLGANSTESKIAESLDAIKNGAQEIDMVINIGWAKMGKFELIKEEISKIVKESKKIANVVVKVILETCLLTDDEIKNVCICAKSANADFVKTSTGFATPKDSNGKLLENGATVHHVKLMRETVGPYMGVKASGGIRTAKSAAEMIDAGATRIGTSSGEKILQEWE